MDYKIFKQWFEEIGLAYNVDPRLLRLDDPLKMLNDIDSWELWHGTEKLDEIFEREYKEVDDKEYEIIGSAKTIADLLNVIVKLNRSIGSGW